MRKNATSYAEEWIIAQEGRTTQRLRANPILSTKMISLRVSKVNHSRAVPTCHRRLSSDGTHGHRAGSTTDAPQVGEKSPLHSFDTHMNYPSSNDTRRCLAQAHVCDLFCSSPASI